jgi:hypothetical protein
MMEEGPAECHGLLRELLEYDDELEDEQGDGEETNFRNEDSQKDSDWGSQGRSTKGVKETITAIGDCKEQLRISNPKISSPIWC